MKIKNLTIRKIKRWSDRAIRKLEQKGNVYYCRMTFSSDIKLNEEERKKITYEMEWALKDFYRKKGILA